ncbi:thioesterase family protein [Acinetobacter sp. MD2(2019)]|uniref:thioesterase family protein n=1 Tax=Acinetobacter sp. MD2(2019) TaxID=2605273 RepID=UPI002D1EA208|nr:thioesterase family protein [Acinetobacter sp. MD2(2019)]MEB3754716.1 thioesterase family protein [Acinetobacter sp. MD2(2019)]
MTKGNFAEWTGQLVQAEPHNFDAFIQQLCVVFNTSPFFAHNAMSMQVVNGEIEAKVEMQPFLVGNLAYQILHGGVAATLLDSIGGVHAMAALYQRAETKNLDETLRKISRLATLDLRVDYLVAGKGAFFIARAETLRMGQKSCTMRMNLHNDQQLLIATAIASYAY